MSHARIVNVSVSPETGWALLRDQLAELAEAWSASDPTTRVQLIRVDDARGLLVITGSQDASLQRIAREILDSGNIVVKGLTHTSGTVVFSTPARSDNAVADLAPPEGPQRVEHFLLGIAASGEVWGLYGGSWARSTAMAGVEALPFWSTRELAADCVRGDWSAHAPRAIALDEFVEQWLPNMDEDGIVAVLAQTPATPGVVIAAAELGDLLAGEAPA